MPPPPPRTRTFRGTADTVAATLGDSAKPTAVVGSDVISFVEGVSSERREAIIHSSLVAEPVAKQRVEDSRRVYERYDAYFDALANIGWVLQDRNWAEYREESRNFDSHLASLGLATVLLGCAPPALQLEGTTLEALLSINQDSPWITIFNRESQSANTARFDQRGGAGGG